MNDSLQQLMRQATELTQAGELSQASQLLRRAMSEHLQGQSLEQSALWSAQTLMPLFASMQPQTVADADVIEVAARRVEEPLADARPTTAGEFSSGSHTHLGLTRRYKLFVPAGPAIGPRAVVVMLHGCSQNPDDFAAGTAMNLLAQAQGFCVLYPAQSASPSQQGHAQRCWNWFNPGHQQRGAGEPALLADLLQTLQSKHGLDRRRIYIAGLSAGGAMAAIVAAAYPELFAAVGIHSGLPVGAASSLPEALAAMRSGAEAAQIASGAPLRIPTIVFHGDQDAVVHPRNGEQIVRSVQGLASAAPLVTQGYSKLGQHYTRSAYRNSSGQVQAEHWLLHGGGHAWSGGQATGSFTEPLGPDASAEMLRFFSAHRSS